MSRPHSSRQRERQLRRRRLVRIAAVLFAVGGVAAVAALGLHLARERRFAAQRTAAIELASAGAGDMETAVADLKLAVQRRPNDVDAVAALARATMKRTPARREHVIEAVRYYNRVVELQPERIEDRTELVRLLDHLGASDVLVKAIEPLIQAHPKDPLFHELRTRHLMALGRLKEAEAAAKAWTAAAPDRFQAQLIYVGLLTGSGKDPRESGSYLNSALARADNQDVATAVRAVSLLGSNQPKEATPLIDGLLAQNRRDPQLDRVLVTALDQLGRKPEADALLATSLADKPDGALLVTSALRDIDRANYARALESIEKAPLPGEDIRRAYHAALLAFLAGRAGKTDVADRAAKELESMPIEVAAVWRAALRGVALEPGDKDLARELLPQLRVSVLLDEEAPLLQLATANCLILLDQLRAADRLLGEAARQSAGWSIGAKRLVELRLSRGEFVQAIEAAQLAFTRSGRTIDAAVTLALAVAASRPTGAQADNLLQLLRQIHTSIPGEVQTLGLYVDLLAQRNDPAAKSVLSEALSRGTPAPVEFLLQWADLSQKHRLGVEEACLSQAAAVGGMTPRIALSSALLLHRAGKTDEATQQLHAARDAQPDRRRVYDEAIATFLTKIRSRDAAEAWNTLAAANPSDVALQQRVLELGFGGTPDNRRALIDRIRKSDPNNVAAELADIRLALDVRADRQTMDDAMMRLTRVIERFPDLTTARLLLIDLLMRTQNTKAALAQWEKAASLQPDEPTLLLTGTQLLIANGERTRARDTLRKLDRLDPNLNDAQRQDAARLHLALGDEARTIDILTRIEDVSEQGRLLLAEAEFRSGGLDACRAIVNELLARPSLDALLFAAAIEDVQGNRDGSEALLLRARDLPELTDADRIRIAEFARERGRLDRVAGFLSTDGASGELTIRIARLWIEQGDVDAAIKALSVAAGRSSDAAPIRRRLREEPRLRKLGELKMFGVAAELLDRPDEVVIQRLVRFALETPAQTVREQQLALDGLAASEGRNDALSMFVAERFMAMNQPALAEKHARQAADLRPAAPQPMALAAQALSRAGNTGRCAEAIREWRDRLPAYDTRPDGLDAQNLARRKEYSELLARFESKAKTTRTSQEVLFAVAEAMHARNRDADAAALLKSAFEPSPHLAIAWLGVAPQGLSVASATSAIEMVREISSKRQAPAEAVAVAIASDRLARKTRDGRQMEVANSALASLESTANALPADCVVQLAENRVARGELAVARAIYERALPSRRDASALLANLAEVLRREQTLPEALETIDRSISADGGRASAHDTRAAILLELQRPDEALVAAQAASRLDPLNPAWMLRVAAVQHAKGDFLAARSTMETLRWFFREPDAWSPDLIGRFRELEERMNRRPANAAPAK